MTPDKLPLDLIKNMWADAERYTEEKVKAINEEHFNVYNAHIAGATAWAGWKVRHDELQATIDDKIDKALHAERNKMQAKITGIDMDWINRAQGLVDALEWIKTYGPADDLTVKFVNKALREFKDGKGKEVENESP